MGNFTRTWTRTENPITEDYCQCIKALVYDMVQKGVRLCGANGTGLPVVDREGIAFNGDAASDFDHDSFILDNEAPAGEYICRTAGKPYDAAVAAALKIAEALHLVSNVSESQPGDEYEVDAFAQRDRDAAKEAKKILMHEYMRVPYPDSEPQTDVQDEAGTYAPDQTPQEVQSLAQASGFDDIRPDGVGSMLQDNEAPDDEDIYRSTPSDDIVQAEEILGMLGLSLNQAVCMMVRQIIYQNGLPFDVKLPRQDGSGMRTSDCQGHATGK